MYCRFVCMVCFGLCVLGIAFVCGVFVCMELCLYCVFVVGIVLVVM